MVKKVVKRKSKINHEKFAAVLCYFLFGIIWYFVDKKMNQSKLVKFHVKQAINLWIISTLANIVTRMMWVFGHFISSAVGVAIFVLWIIGIIYAASARKEYIPFLGEFAEKYLKF
jgi:uncharacterized membrane protein